MVGELAQWYSQHSLIGGGRGFSGCVNQRIPALWADLDFTSGSARGISDGTRVSGSDDKTS